MPKSIAVIRHVPKNVLSSLVKDSLAQIVLLSVFLFSLLHVYCGISLYYPDISTFVFIFKHYIGPVFLLSFFSPFFLKISLFDFIYTSLSFSVIVFLHFNLKLISMILTKTNFDNVYLMSDLLLGGIVETFCDVYNLLRLDAARDWHLYHNLFVFLFFFSFFLGARHGYFKKIVLATGVLMLIGGVSYSFGAAYGPFIFDLPNALPVQKMMFYFYINFIKSNGLLYKPENFVSSLGAMPSLHIGNTILFLLFSVKYENSITRTIYYILLFFFCIVAVALKWHYLVDFIAGLLLAIISCWAAGLWSNEEKDSHVSALIKPCFKSTAIVFLFFVLLFLRLVF